MDYAALASEQSLAATQAKLEANGFKTIVVDSLEQAKATFADIVPKGSDVFVATSRTLDQAGISELVDESGDYTSVRKQFMALYGQEDKAIEMRQLGSAMAYVTGSVHAVTEDGSVLIASATGSQLPAYVYGASNVVWVVSTKKIVPDMNAGFDRITSHVLPLEDVRALEAYGVHSSVNKVLVVNKDAPGRITIIFVKEDAGF